MKPTRRPSCLNLFSPLLLLLCFSAGPARGDALDQLQRLNPPPTPELLTSLGFGGGVFIAADSVYGDVFTSPDGLAWTAVGNVGSNSITRFAHGAGRFVAITSHGAVLSSENGSAWVVRLAGPATLRDIAFGAGTFVILAPNAVLTSADGLTWTTNTAGVPAGVSTFTGSLSYGNGLFFAAGNTGSVYTSPDGATWTAHVPNMSYLQGYASAGGGGLFVLSGARSQPPFSMVSGWWTSTDGNSWLLAPVTGLSFTFSQLLFDSGKFAGLAASQGNPNPLTVYISTNGTNWTQASTPASMSVEKIAAGNGVWVGIQIPPNGATLGRIARSTDGLNWSLVPVPPADRSFSVSRGAYGAGHYVLAGSSLVTSTDGIHFTKSMAVTSINDIVYAGAQFVTVGNAGSVARSADGETWSASRSGTLNTLNAVAHGNGRYLAVGYGGMIRVSQDGVVWNGVWSGTDYNLFGIARGNGQFVAVGHLGIVLTSPDGLLWTARDNPDFSTLIKITFDGGKFIAVGASGAVLTSANGSMWTRHANGITNTLQNITYGGGLYVAVANGRVFSSTDAMNWQERTGYPTVLGSAFLNEAWGLVGSAGTIYGAPPTAAAILSAGANSSTGDFEVKVAGGEAGLYRLQSCTNLTAQAWGDVMTFVHTQAVTTVIVPGGVGAPQCYYRAVIP